MWTRIWILSIFLCFYVSLVNCSSVVSRDTKKNLEDSIEEHDSVEILGEDQGKTVIATIIPSIEAEEPSTESVTFYIRGHNYLTRNEPVEAERSFNTVIEIEPEFARGWDGRGESFLLQKKYKEAIKDFDRALTLKPNLSQAYAHRSIAKLSLGDLIGAKLDADAAIEMEPESVDANIVLGRIYSRNGENDKALYHHNEAVRILPNDGLTYWWRGRFFRDSLKLFDQAMLDFNKAAELDPSFAGIYLDRAILKIIVDAKKDTIRTDLEEALSLAEDPELPDIIEQSKKLLDQISQGS